jgi:hypothetical protein
MVLSSSVDKALRDLFGPSLGRVVRGAPRSCRNHCRWRRSGRRQGGRGGGEVATGADPGGDEVQGRGIYAMLYDIWSIIWNHMSDSWYHICWRWWYHDIMIGFTDIFCEIIYIANDIMPLVCAARCFHCKINSSMSNSWVELLEPFAAFAADATAEIGMALRAADTMYDFIHGHQGIVVTYFLIITSGLYLRIVASLSCCSSKAESRPGAHANE